MLFIHDTAQWLDEVDPWSDQEALDLFEAVRNCRSQGLFHCSLSADGGTFYVLTAHASAVLVLATPEAWQAFIREIGWRHGLSSPTLIQAAQTTQGLSSSSTEVSHGVRSMPFTMVEAPRSGITPAPRNAATCLAARRPLADSQPTLRLEL